MRSLASDPLSGRAILVTRPRAQAQRLARLIEEAGGRAHLFPAIEIEDVAPPAALARLHEFDLAIFVSPTAVAKAMPQVRAWPRALRVAAVGSGTRRELEKRGIADVISPASGADSEALLATPALGDVAGRRIAILRGDGGRALLGETFVARGAQVEYITCYRRLVPKPPAHSWKPGELAAVTVSSSQGLDNLFAGPRSGAAAIDADVRAAHAHRRERADAVGARSRARRALRRGNARPANGILSLPWLNRKPKARRVRARRCCC